MASHIHHCADEINPDASVPRYPLRSDPHAVLVPPLNFDRRVHNNLVSVSSNGAPATMTTESRTGVPKDSGVPAEIANTLSTILAQLSTINKWLELQGVVIARHDQLLEGGNGSVFSTPSSAKHMTQTRPDNPTPGSGGGGHNNNGPHHPSGPNNREFRDDLRNSFHCPKLNFPRYDSEVDPLPWLYHCESYFRGTRIMAVEQVWLASLHMDGAATEWYYALEHDYGMLPWTRLTELANLWFGPSIRSNPLGELKELHRIGTVEEYQRQFLQLLCHCEGLSPDESLHDGSWGAHVFRHRDVAAR